MSLLFDALKAMSLGVVASLALPIVSRAASWEQRRGLIETYISMAMNALGRGVMVIRSNGGQRLKQTKYDYSTSGETTRLGGEKMTWRNPENMMHTLAGKPFGIVHEDKDTIVDIRTAHLAELYRDYKQEGLWRREGDEGEYFKAYANIPIGTEVVDIRPVTRAVQSSAGPGLADRLDTFVEKMESLFNSNNVVEYLPWIMGMGAGFGLMLLASKALSTTGGSVTIGI